MDSIAAAENWDVIVIGGGPSGSTAATVLAQAGKRVLVLEKEKFPRFHIGESLLPYNRSIFDDLGVWEKLSTAGFQKKRGAQFWMGDATRHNRLDFSKGSFTEFPDSIQVERSKFDQILLNHSQELGAVVREESLVTGYKVGKDEVVVHYRQGGEEKESRAAFLMDASGLANFTGNKVSLRKYYSGHRKIAIYGHFEDVQMPEGEEQGDIIIVRRHNSWFWMIPLNERKTSVGLVMDLADFKAACQKPDVVFNGAVKDTKAVSRRFENAKPLSEIHVTTDFSYQNRKFVSERLVRIGDAAGFIDPIFSSGVMLAMASGQDGAKVVLNALEKRRALTPEMKRFEKMSRERIGIYWEFIENFYKIHFAQIFFQPVNKFKMVCAINSVLAGRTKLPLTVRLRLRIFFTLAWLNKHMPVAKRIAIQ